MTNRTNNIIIRVLDNGLMNSKNKKYIFHLLRNNFQVYSIDLKHSGTNFSMPYLAPSNMNLNDSPDSLHRSQYAFINLRKGVLRLILNCNEKTYFKHVGIILILYDATSFYFMTKYHFLDALTKSCQPVRFVHLGQGL